MDLYAYSQIENLEAIANANGIDVPRLRGYRLMADEEPITAEKIAELKADMAVGIAESMVRATPKWELHPTGTTYGGAVDRKVKKHFVLDEDGNPIQIKWETIHGKHRSNLKLAIKQANKDVDKQYEMFNKYAGKPGVLYIHARIGGLNWSYYNGKDITSKPWFLDRVDDCYDNTYCDIYAKINTANLKKMMKSKGITTVTQLAKETGIDKSCLTQYRLGHTTPRASKIEILAKYFGVEPSAFYAQPHKSEPLDLNSDKGIYLKGVADCMSAMIEYLRELQA